MLYWTGHGHSCCLLVNFLNFIGVISAFSCEPGKLQAILQKGRESLQVAASVHLINNNNNYYHPQPHCLTDLLTGCPMRR